MEMLFLGGVFSLSHQDEIIRKTKTYVEYAANSFQMKLISGFKKNNVNLSIISAPFIGAYPNAYKDWNFNGFENCNTDEEFIYVPFVNIWGIRNMSRMHSLKKAIMDFTRMESQEKIIIVYTTHTPLLEAAYYAKKFDPKIKICLVVPDLPQYMNLASSRRILYDFFKQFDIKKFNKLCKHVDCFVLLTEAMKDELKVGNRPYLVVEGIVDENTPLILKDNTKKSVVYTGKMNKNFGVLDLISAFKMIKMDDIELILCGSGELDNEIVKEAKKDSRIQFKGQITMNEAKRYISMASVLVNPRQNTEEYTKFSFPSKNLDYLMSGRPLVGYKLDGIPNEYDDFIIYPTGNSISELCDAIKVALKISSENYGIVGEKIQEHLTKNKSSSTVCMRILSMITNC